MARQQGQWEEQCSSDREIVITRPTAKWSFAMKVNGIIAQPNLLHSGSISRKSPRLIEEKSGSRTWDTGIEKVQAVKNRWESESSSQWIKRANSSPLKILNQHWTTQEFWSSSRGELVRSMDGKRSKNFKVDAIDPAHIPWWDQIIVPWFVKWDQEKSLSQRFGGPAKGDSTQKVGLHRKMANNARFLIKLVTGLSLINYQRKNHRHFWSIL